MDIASGLTVVNSPGTAGCLEPVIDAVESLYLQIDRDTAAFAGATGIACPEGCGRCCHSTSVEASVLEMLPMTRALFRSGLIDSWEAAIGAGVWPGRCLVFEINETVADKGRCRLYGWRPLVCRLFGFAARKNKNGLPAFSACREFATRHPVPAGAAAAAVAGGLPVPVFASYQMQVSALHATLGSPLMPINKAFQQAVNRYGFLLQMGSAVASMETPQDDPHRGPEGRLPPRLAA